MCTFCPVSSSYRFARKGGSAQKDRKGEWSGVGVGEPGRNVSSVLVLLTLGTLSNKV